MSEYNTYPFFSILPSFVYYRNYSSYNTTAILPIVFITRGTIVLIFDYKTIGNNLLFYRKKRGLTQYEVAEIAGLSDRTYADIERGTVNMRIETILRICNALHITPDDIMTTDNESDNYSIEQLMSDLNQCSPKEQQTAIKLLQTYIDSLK